MKTQRAQHSRRKPKISQPLWRPEAAISHAALQALVHHNRLDHVLIHETARERYWIAIKIKQQREMMFLATRRDATQPRLFKRLDVISAYLRNSVGLNNPWTLKLWTNIHNSK